MYFTTMYSFKSLYIFPLAFQTPMGPERAVPGPHLGLSQSSVELAFSSCSLQTTPVASVYSITSATLAETLANGSNAEPNTESSAESKEVGAKTEPTAKKPEYECDNDFPFFCEHCGGATKSTTWINNGEPNSICKGLLDGMWEGCDCWDPPESQIYPYPHKTPEERERIKERRPRQKWHH
ncbi:hypothetical protein BDV95DRAFT_582022 [Massariosphaeria phaeospora]|uniref:Uncharacterized protein n=1 Tax=Massariosphaeria phaeospora TaxID=100035 RepID=A0A7C8I3Z0_9PLEO|nr:hypothetical protein BDV95DRAFT_582022 [Massariosphaeria phaeospora]